MVTCPADLVVHFGILDLSDINAFTSALIAGEPAADIDGNRVHNLTDINVFVALIVVGSP